MGIDYRVSREYTCRLLEMIDDGYISAETVLNELLNWLPESDVKSFVIDADLIEYNEEE